jgi:6-phosphogluconolactonase
MQHLQLNRRRFLRILGIAPLAMRASPQTLFPSPSFVYIGSGCDQIHVFRVDGCRWTLQQIVPCKAPASLTIHPNRRLLYAVNQVAEHQRLPRGSVESFTIDGDGRLAAFSETSLSLSATHPSHLALSPDGKKAVVAIHGGGAYNLLINRDDDQPLQVAGIFKEVGCGPDALRQVPAHPNMALFDTTHNRVIASDTASDRISVFTLNEAAIQVRQRFSTEAGSGPAHLILHPKGDILFVANQRNRSICSYKYDSRHGKVLHCIQQIAEDTGGPMALHPSARTLYTTSAGGPDVIQAWNINQTDGRLIRIQSWHKQCGRAIAMATDGNALLVTSDTAPGILHFASSSTHGHLRAPTLAAEVPRPLSIATL